MARGSVFVGRVGNGKMQITISLILAQVLHVCLADAEQLQLASRAGRTKIRLGILRPLQHGADGDVLKSSFRQCYVLGCRAVLLRNGYLRGCSRRCPRYRRRPRPGRGWRRQVAPCCTCSQLIGWAPLSTVLPCLRSGARVPFQESALPAAVKFPTLGAFPKRRGLSPKGDPAAPTLYLATSYHAIGAECEGGSIYGRQQAGGLQVCRCWSYAWCWQ
jgi:hypothetical protein